MKIHPESHLDHHLTDKQREYIAARFADRLDAFLETIELPAELGTVPCGLYGPIMGDSPIADADSTGCGDCDPCRFYGPGTQLCHAIGRGAWYERRGKRSYKSRLVARPMRPTSKLTVIAGPHDEICPTCGGNTALDFIAAGMAPAGTSWRCPTCDSTGKVHHECILYTAFGGPQAPQEPGDIRQQIEALEAERRERDQREGDPARHHTFVNLIGTDEYLAERSKLDPIYAKIVALREKRSISDEFWRSHALVK